MSEEPHIKPEYLSFISESFWQTIIDHSSEVIYVADEDGVLLTVNSRFAALIGLTKEEIPGKKREQIMAPEIAAQHRANDIKVINAGEAVTFDEENIEKDGLHHYTTIKFPLRDKDYKIFAVAGISTDITDQKQALDSLKRERQILEAIFNSVPGMLYLYDTEGHLIEWNRRHEQMTGYTSEELAKMTLMDWYRDDPESQASVLKGLESTEKNGFGEAEALLQCKDGRKIPMYFTAVPLTIKDRNYFAGIGIDLSERKRVEQEKAQLQQQLLQSQKLESIGRLAGGVAHDYNNMLSVIIGYTEMSLDCVNKEDPLYTNLKEILAAATRSADITRQLLAFARKQTIAPEVLNLNKVVEGMLKMLRWLIREEITINWQGDPDAGEVMMDPTQVDQILANLCVNARDAIDGIGTITIETGSVLFDEQYCASHPEFVPGDYAMLAISDDGRGMDKETMARIFEPFFTTKELGRGTGLGLATIYGIVKQNSGLINVYSEPGKGSCFRIYLPRYSGSEKIRDLTQSDEIIRGRGERILLVEDEPALLSMTKQMLENSGYTVLAATRAIDALNIAGSIEGNFQLLVTDVVMPDMNGRELSERMVSLYPHLKVLYMSGYTAKTMSSRGILEEGTNYLPKPFTNSELAHRVSKALRQS